MYLSFGVLLTPSAAPCSSTSLFPSAHSASNLAVSLAAPSPSSHFHPVGASIQTTPSYPSQSASMAGPPKHFVILLPGSNCYLHAPEKVSLAPHCPPLHPSSPLSLQTSLPMGSLPPLSPLKDQLLCCNALCY